MKRVFIAILCCGRVDLLEKTLGSFFERCKDLDQYEVHAIVSDDSGDSFLNKKIEDIVNLFFPINRSEFRFGTNVGQAASFWHLSRMISKKFSEKDLCFILEEDWTFTEDFNLSNAEKYLGQNNIASVVLRSDVDNFESYPAQGYNIVESFDSNLLLIAPREMQEIAKIKGNCPHNEIICFHPGLIWARDASKYSSFYNLEDLILIKESAERLLGLITKGLRSFLVDKTYTLHTGDYRIYSVFPGAKIRKGIKMINVDELKSKMI